MAEIRELLDEMISREIENLEELSREEKSQAIKDLVQLHKLRIEEVKTEADISSDKERTEADINRIYAELSLKERELDAKNEELRIRDEEDAKANKKETIDRFLRTGVAVLETVLPVAFYGIWMSRGFRFEETGSFTSTTFKNLISRFRPTK